MKTETLNNIIQLFVLRYYIPISFHTLYTLFSLVIQTDRYRVAAHRRLRWCFSSWV